MIRYKKDRDNIVTLILDMKGRNYNIINHEVGKAILPIISYLKEEKAKRKLRGIIIASAKDNFLVGGDLDYIYESTDPNIIFELSQKMQSFYRELEGPGVPVVAAINGNALGSGLELALACHHRIVLDNPKIRLGHPEVSLGIMPGSGGVIRLLWLLGIEKAYEVLSSANRYSPREALKAGFIDELANDENDLIVKAKKWISKNFDICKPWDTKEGTIPFGTANELETGFVIQKLTANLLKQTNNNYSAPKVILKTLAEASKVNFDTGCKIESRNFTNLVKSSSAKNMIKAFWYDFNLIKDGLSRPKGFGKFRPKKVGIIGAGNMGVAIAGSCLHNGMEVILKDVSKAIADRGKELVIKNLQSTLEKGKISKQYYDKLISKIIATGSAEEFDSCDLVIEAVFENAPLKIKVGLEAEKHMDKYAFMATNTISIPISQLAKSFKFPNNYIGLHFFRPVEKVPLVEIVKGKETSDETVSRAFDFVKAIKKIPIVVKDNWGFYVARVQNTFILEGITLLQEGFMPALIEQVSLRAGMPQGPLDLADELSLPIVLKYESQAADHYGSKYIQHPATMVLQRMIEDFDRKGKVKKQGFYDYQEDGSNLWSELNTHFMGDKMNYASQVELSERLIFVQVLEAAWCLQEGIIKTVAEANLGSIYGWGFPAFRGGVIQFVNDYGVSNFIEKCQHYEELHGPRFKVPKFILKMNKTKETSLVND